ncbi:MAG: ABC transporter permease/substrate-binding protein, partial [Acidobacteria bacterium]|nr:ABC transporter permease/substrate-binding protein [Acidobacteriota bacterium]
RNTVTGLRGVDPALLEAARAMGMTPGQSLRQVELPLAAPFIVAGLRTSTVWTVGTATLATPVGQTCLGNYIFMGLQTRNLTAVLFGSVAAATLAIFLDGLIGALETGVRTGSRRRVVMAAVLLALLLSAGLMAPWLSRSQSGGENPRRAWTVGAKTFTEQYILAALLQDTLTQAGLPVARREGLGSTVLFDALTAGQVDLYVDYSGTLWANHMKRKGGGSRREVLGQVTRWLETTHGIRCLGPLGFENAYVLAMARDDAARRGIRSVADLQRLGANLRIGGDYEFFGRPEWLSLRDTYGLAAATRTSYDSTFMYEAVARGEVDVISAFGSDGRIAAYDLVVLAEPQGVLPPYDALLLLSPRAGASPELIAALSPLLDAINVDLMRQANNMVDRDDDPRTVSEAAAWLAGQIAGQGAP